MKSTSNKSLLVVAFMLLTGLITAKAAATVQQLGSIEENSWTATSDVTDVLSGSTLTLDGTVMTFMGTNNTWQWHSGNSGLLGQNTPGATESTFYSSWTVDNGIPAYGSVYKFVATEAGTLTLVGKSAKTKYYFVKDVDGTLTIEKVGTGTGNGETYTCDLEANTDYYFFQLGSTLQGGRYTLRTVTFEKTAAPEPEPEPQPAAEGVLYQRGDTWTAWSDADLTEWVADKADYGTVMVNDVETQKVTRTANSDGLAFNSLGGKTNAGFAANTNATACHFTKTLAGNEVPQTNTLLTYNIVWKAGSPTGSADKTNAYIKFGDVTFRFYGQNTVTKVTIGDDTSTLPTAGKTRNGTYTLTVTVNQQTKVVHWIFKGNGSETDEGYGTSAAENFNTIEYGIAGTMPLWSISSNLYSISITEEAAPASANYTVNFVDENGKAVKESEIRSGTIGDPIVLYATDREPFYADKETKYFYKSDDSEGKTVLQDGSVVINVTYRLAETYNWLARGVYEDYDLVFAQGAVLEGESATIRPPKYMLIDGTSTLLTQAADKASLAVAITPDQDNYNYTVNYKLHKDNVMFFAEAENVRNLTKTIDDVYCKDRLSNGAGAFASGVKVAVASIPCGKYKMYVGAMGSTNIDFTINDNVVCTAAGSQNSNVETTSNEFTLDERSIVYLEPGGNAGKTTSVASAIDYIIIEQTEKGTCVDSGEEELPDSETVPELRIVEEHVFKDISVKAKAREHYAIQKPAGSTRKEGKPVVFYLGDSTTRNGSAGNGGNGLGEWGWAFYAQEFIDSTKAVTENHAMGGLSSRTFYTGNLASDTPGDYWTNVRDNIQPGDFVVIGFGHNDGGSNYKDGRSSLSGYSATETQEVTHSNGVKETIYTFGQYLRFFINETRERGGIPVLVSMSARGMGETATAAGLNNSQRAWTKAVAEEMNVSFIDIALKAKENYDKYGAWKVAQFYSGQYSGLHFNLRGAWETAWYHAQCIFEDENNPLHNYVVDPTPAKLNITRNGEKPYIFNIGGSLETSARDCYRSGDWHLVYNTIEAGDTVKMKFGASELTHQQKDGELGSIQSAEDELVKVQSLITNRFEQTGSYGWYIHYFSNDVKEKGGIPVLVTASDAPEEIIKWNTEIAERLGIELQVEEIIITGIRDMKGNGVKVNGYYDLQGRQIVNGKTQKGLYIINGNKVIIK